MAGPWPCTMRHAGSGGLLILACRSWPAAPAASPPQPPSNQPPSQPPSTPLPRQELTVLAGGQEVAQSSKQGVKR